MSNVIIDRRSLRSRSRRSLALSTANWPLLPLKALFLMTGVVGAAVIIAILLGFFITVFVAAGFIVGGTLIAYRIARWTVDIARPRAKTLPASLRQAALASDPREASLLLTASLHRLYEDALSVDIGAVRKRGRATLRRVAAETREVVRLLQTILYAARTQSPAHVARLRTLLESADDLRQYAGWAARSGSLGLDELWVLERQRMALMEERDRLIAELISWTPNRT
jgi:hypothetical protein